MAVPLIEQKRSYLIASAKWLKTEKGVTQRDIAERMQESEGAFSGRLSGQRGIPDDYIDRFSAEFGIPFNFGDGIGKGLDSDLISMFANKAETNTNLINLVLTELRALRAEVKEKV